SRSTNKPSLLGSPNRTAASAPGGSMAGAGPHLMSCDETLVCPSIVSAGVVKATPATATAAISVGNAIFMDNLLSRFDYLFFVLIGDDGRSRAISTARAN